MDFKVLAVGDVVGEPGLDRLARSLRYLKRKTGADFVVVNGENASGVGITTRQAEEILDDGADCITLGNHTFNQRDIVSYLDESFQIIRPANYAPQAPGRGWAEFDTKAGTVAVINLIGRCNMEYGPDNPFLAVEKILKQIKAKIILIDFHAEATSEMLAMGYMLDGRVSALWGTHTHVPTADACVLPKKTGYVTDLGMTGPVHSVLGVIPEQSIAMFRGDLTSRFKTAGGATKLEAVLFTIDSATGKCKAAERVDLHE